VQSFPTEDAGAVGVQERRDDDVADLHGADVGADSLDDADELVSHAAAGLAVFHCLVRPQIAAADCGAADGDEGVGGFDQAGVGHGLDTDVAGAEHDGCAHRGLPPVSGGLQVVDVLGAAQGLLDGLGATAGRDDLVAGGQGRASVVGAHAAPGTGDEEDLAHVLPPVSKGVPRCPLERPRPNGHARCLVDTAGWVTRSSAPRSADAPGAGVRRVDLPV
jgi:hypothetical protein